MILKGTLTFIIDTTFVLESDERTMIHYDDSRVEEVNIDSCINSQYTQVAVKNSALHWCIFFRGM